MPQICYTTPVASYIISINYIVNTLAFEARLINYNFQIINTLMNMLEILAANTDLVNADCSRPETMLIHIHSNLSV